MAKTRKDLIFITIAVIALVLMLFFPIATVQSGLVVPEYDKAYMQALSQAHPELKISTSPFPASTRFFSNGISISTFDTQAVPLLETSASYSFSPHYVQTVVIAIDRDQTDIEIDSFRELLDSNQPINFNFGSRVAENMWEYPQTHQITIALADALYGEYDVHAVAGDIEHLYKNNCFSCNDMDLPISITYDTTAVALMKSGRNLEIIIPSDGTLSFLNGLMIYKDSITVDTETLSPLLIESGFRLPDGSADRAYYPPDEDYTRATFVEDFTEYNKATSLVSKTLRRSAFDTRLFGFTNQKETSVAYFILLFIILMSLMSIIHRVTSKSLRNALVIICSLQIYSVTSATLKSITTQIPALETFLWYSYYISFLFIPATFLYISITLVYSAHRAYIKTAYRIYLIITFCLLALVFTNTWHELVFIVHDHISTKFSYNFGYPIVMGWAYISSIIALGLLIYKSFNTPSKKTFLAPMVVIVICFSYTLCYALDIWYIRDFDVSFSFSLMVLIYMEACLQSRLLPVNKGYKKLFSNSNLHMEIHDTSGGLFAQSTTPPHKNTDLVLRQKAINGGYFSYFEDYSSLNTALENLAKVNSELEKNNIFLTQQAKVNIELSALEAEKEAYRNIDCVLNKGTDKIAIFLEKLKKSGSNKELIALINITACTIKRECMMLINMLYKNEQPLNTFVSSILEMQEFTTPIRLKITLSCTVTGVLPLSYTLTMYHFFCTLLEKATTEKCSDMLIQLYETEHDIIFSVITDKIIFEQDMLHAISGAISDNTFSFCAKPWDDTQSLLLSFAKEGRNV